MEAFLPLADRLPSPQVLMADVASLEPSADDCRSASDQVLQSGLVDPGQSRKIQERMSELNGRWNTLNVEVIEKEMRLVGFSSFHVVLVPPYTIQCN